MEEKKEIPFICGLCNVEFSFEKELKNHMVGPIHKVEKPSQMTKKEPRFSCPTCCKYFQWKCLLKFHISSVHEGKKIFQCKFCPKQYTQSNNLKIHMQNSHEKANSINKCNWCNKNFSGIGPLNRHIRVIHENSEKYICNECDKIFNDGGALKRHTQENKGSEM